MKATKNKNLINDITDLIVKFNPNLAAESTGGEQYPSKESRCLIAHRVRYLANLIIEKEHEKHGIIPVKESCDIVMSAFCRLKPSEGDHHHLDLAGDSGFLALQIVEKHIDKNSISSVVDVRGGKTISFCRYSLG